MKVTKVEGRAEAKLVAVVGRTGMWFPSLNGRDLMYLDDYGTISESGYTNLNNVLSSMTADEAKASAIYEGDQVVLQF